MESLRKRCDEDAEEMSMIGLAEDQSVAREQGPITFGFDTRINSLGATPSRAYASRLALIYTHVTRLLFARLMGLKSFLTHKSTVSCPPSKPLTTSVKKILHFAFITIPSCPQSPRQGGSPAPRRAHPSSANARLRLPSRRRPPPCHERRTGCLRLIPRPMRRRLVRVQKRMIPVRIKKIYPRFVMVCLSLRRHSGVSVGGRVLARIFPPSQSLQDDLYPVRIQ